MKYSFVYKHTVCVLPRVTVSKTQNIPDKREGTFGILYQKHNPAKQCATSYAPTSSDLSLNDIQGLMQLA